MSRKQDIIANLQKLMRERRAQIDPKVLAAVRAKIQPKGDGTAERAGAAVELFFKNHPEPGKFRAKLLDFLSRNSH
jgi:hypothetical protein